MFIYFCEHCWTPQKITDFVIKHYLAKKDVKGIYCSNCSCFNSITIDDRVEIFRKL